MRALAGHNHRPPDRHRARLAKLLQDVEVFQVFKAFWAQETATEFGAGEPRFFIEADPHPSPDEAYSRRTSGRSTPDDDYISPHPASGHLLPEGRRSNMICSRPLGSGWRSTGECFIFSLLPRSVDNQSGNTP